MKVGRWLLLSEAGDEERELRGITPGVLWEASEDVLRIYEDQSSSLSAEVNLFWLDDIVRPNSQVVLSRCSWTSGE